jgi:D-alanyl-D-alanine carboxypeptidase (penicillin-binding protein 5/6)
LILAIAVGAFMVPASSYENDVETSSVAMLLLNLDTDTPCYAVRENGKWYASYMSEMVTFLVAYQNIPDLKGTQVTVSKDFISSLPYSDGCLSKFIGKKLTAEDLMAIMMFSSGSDAAYILADIVSPGNVSAFVDKMNAKLSDLGCASSHVVSPGFSDSKLQLTTCSDLAKIFKALYSNELYQRIMENPVYTPEGYDEEDFSVITQNSLCNPNSAYYFRYTTGGKFTYSKFSSANLVATTTYRGMTYLFVALRGKLTSEENVFLDGRRLTTWAYLNLSDRKVIDAGREVATYTAVAPWGEYEAALPAGNSAYKTLPNAFEQDRLSYKISLPERVELPIFVGQGIGTAKIYYDGQKIDDIALVSSEAEGVSLLRDIAGLARYAMHSIAPVDPSAGAETPTETPLYDEETEAPAPAPATEKPAPTAAAKTEG